MLWEAKKEESNAPLCILPHSFLRLELHPVSLFRCPSGALEAKSSYPATPAAREPCDFCSLSPPIQPHCRQFKYTGLLFLKTNYYYDLKFSLLILITFLKGHDYIISFFYF